MLKQLANKNEYLLAAGTALLFFLCYQLAFKATIEAWNLNRQLRAQQVSAGGMSYQPEYLVRKNTNLDTIIAHYKVDSVTWRNYAISTVALEAEKLNVKLSAVPAQGDLFQTDKYSIQRLGFEGDFFHLVKLLRQLQHIHDIGYVRSVTLKTRELRSGRDISAQLYMELYLEVIK